MDLPPPALPDNPDFRDRHAWLVVFGVFEIMLGAFCALMIPLTLFGEVAQSRNGGHDFDFATLATALLTFAVFSLGLIWLGVGSALARRWARALLLCLGWMALCFGVVGFAILIPTLGAMDHVMGPQGREVPSAALAIGKFIAVATAVFFYVIIPGLLVLFYRGENVRLTCEMRDPQIRWTDRCPLPVIAACIMLVFGALCMVTSPRFGAAMPMMGSIVTGWPARLAWFGWAAFSLYAARGFYRLERRVWLTYSLVMLLVSVSSLVTFLRVDLMDYYRAVGLPAWQLEQVAKSPLVRNGMLFRICALCALPYFGFLFYLRRFFPARPDQDPPVLP